MDELPSPQRRALEIALVLRDSENGVPDQAAIAFALLGALRIAVTDVPLVVAVDDLQWLDAPSAFALRFAARRLRDEPIGLLLSVRHDGDGGASGAGLLSDERTQQIHVGGLSLGALQRLIQARLDLALPRPLLTRLHESSAGNPFYALELAHALGSGQRELEPRPSTGICRSRQSVNGCMPRPAGRRSWLPARPRDRPSCFSMSKRQDSPAEQELSYFSSAAAASQPTVGLLGAVLGEDEVSARLRPAVDAGLVELLGERVRFAHPLYASAVYGGATPEDKRKIRRRLAAVVDDPEERARHLAASAAGANTDVAAALDEAALIARARGAPQAAAELSELALRLTPEPEAEAAHRRRLDAGAAHFEAGATARARALFAEAAESADIGSLRAEALSRLARVHHYAGDQRLAVELFRECLADPQASAPVQADAAEGLATSLFFLREELADALGHARSAARIAEEDGSRTALAVALGTQGMIEAVLGRPEAARTLQSAVALEEYARELPLGRQPSFQLAVTRVWGDDLDAARAALEAIRQRAVAQGDESSLPFTLTYLSLAEYLSGRWQEAIRAADEGQEVALAADQEIGRAFALSTRALVASCFGREHAARSDAEEALALAERGTMFATTTSLWALGLLELSLDNPAEAHRRLGPLVARVEDTGIGEPGSIRFVTDDVEALVALGDLHAAVAHLERFEEHGRRLGRSSALAASYRCRGLLAAAAGSPDESFLQFQQALDELEQLPLPFERARTLLALGSVQRRARQRRAARKTLEEAQRLFDDLGAYRWSERTKAELGRISGRPPSTGELTASEKRVAELVAEGRTNKQVAAELHLTERTVEGTLSRVYLKLGIRSRTELAHRWVTRS